MRMKAKHQVVLIVSVCWPTLFEPIGLSLKTAAKWSAAQPNRVGTTVALVCGARFCVGEGLYG